MSQTLLEIVEFKTCFNKKKKKKFIDTENMVGEFSFGFLVSTRQNLGRKGKYK